jgi:hypothetical protein
MNEFIDGGELRRLAQETLAREPDPPSRFAAALVANALAIADRATAAAHDAGDAGSDDAALVAAIRAGALDAPGPEREAALSDAVARVRRRLAVTNPARLR